MKRMLSAVVGTVLLAVAPVTSAEAAADISLPGSCSLSAHWPVYTSVNFNNTGGSPSRGYLDYAVVRSPGRVTAKWFAFNPAGTIIDNGGFFTEKRNDAGEYVYSENIDIPGVRKVEIKAEGGNGSCLSGIYSRN